MLSVTVLDSMVTTLTGRAVQMMKCGNAADKKILVIRSLGFYGTALRGDFLVTAATILPPHVPPLFGLGGLNPLLVPPHLPEQSRR